MKIAVFPNYRTASVREELARVCEALNRLSVEVLLPCDEMFPPADADALFSACDVAIALGGDGTIIHCAKRAAAFGKAVLGINCGRLGFMAGLETDEFDQLQRLIDGDYDVDDRMMLDIALTENGNTVRYSALNEAVISRDALTRMIEIDVANHDIPMPRYQADGLIVSTPTGSTAYSLSAGGPVVDPALHCLLLTPICPHSLHTRPYIFNDDARLTIEPRWREDGPRVFLTVEGEEAVAVPRGARVTVTRSEKRAALIKMQHRSFYEVLDRKLTNRKG